MMHAKDLERCLRCVKCSENGSRCYYNDCYFQNSPFGSVWPARGSSNLGARHPRPCLPFQSHHLPTRLQDYLPHKPGSLRVGADCILHGSPWHRACKQ